MTGHHWTVCLLLAGVLVAAWRVLRTARTRPWTRTLLLLIGSCGSALLLYFCMYPPLQPQTSRELVVLLADADLGEAQRQARAGAWVRALPEAPDSAFVEVPDLATALREFPHAKRLLLLGVALDPRDQYTRLTVPTEWRETAVRGTGLAAIHAPSRLAAGADWQVHGTVQAEAGSVVELRDPADVLLVRSVLDREGRFVLQAQAGAAGRALYRLDLRDPKGEVLESLALPVQIESGRAARLLLLAGAPNPEYKFLRRWALDAGLQVESRLPVAPGVQLGSARLQAQTGDGRDWDLIILDERSLASLGAAGRAQLLDLLRAGAGVLLRLGGPLAAAERAWLQSLQLAPAPADIGSRLDWPLMASPAGDGTKAETGSPSTLQLGRRPLTAPAGALPLLRSPDGAVLGAWRPLGQGRLGVLWLTDTHGLQLSGYGRAYAGLWQSVLQVLQRRSARPSPLQRLPEGVLRLHEAVQWCGLDPDTDYEWRDGTEVWPVFVDPGGCARVWPARPGWMELRTSAPGNAAATVLDTLYVHLAEAAPLQKRIQDADATRALLQRAPLSASGQAPPQPGPAWPWFLAWLGWTVLLWWLERHSVRASAADAAEPVR